MAKRLATTPLALPFSKKGGLDSMAQPSSPTASAAAHKSNEKRLDVFPYFKSGDVVIRSRLPSSIDQLIRLHSVVLTRHSPYFSRTIKNQAINATGAFIWHAFAIEEYDGKIALAYGGCYCGDPPAPSDLEPHTAPRLDGVKIKLEGEASQEEPNVVKPNIFKSYAQILALFYNIELSTRETSITAALPLTEQLLLISHDLECLPLVRPHLSKLLSDYRHDLFFAIKNDPIRWLKLGEKLENKSIYAECLIHLIGAYPCQPWSSTRAPAAAWGSLPQDLRHRVKNKSQAMDQLRTEIEKDLLICSLPYSDRPLDPTQRDQTQTWLVVAVFRDLLAQQIYALDPQSNPNAVLDQGTFFRSLAKGTFEPLDGERVRRMCQGIMRAEWRDLLEDLHQLKEYARKAVSDLAFNGLMIDPDAHGVGYITCAKVTDEDIPWLVAKRDGSLSVEKEGD